MGVRKAPPPRGLDGIFPGCKDIASCDLVDHDAITSVFIPSRDSACLGLSGGIGRRRIRDVRTTGGSGWFGVTALVVEWSWDWLTFPGWITDGWKSVLTVVVQYSRKNTSGIFDNTFDLSRQLCRACLEPVRLFYKKRTVSRYLLEHRLCPATMGKEQG